MAPIRVAPCDRKARSATISHPGGRLVSRVGRAWRTCWCGAEARRRGHLGRPRSPLGGGGDRRGRRARGASGTAAAVKPGPGSNRGDDLEGQERDAVDGGTNDGCGVCGVRVGLTRRNPRRCRRWLNDREAYAMQRCGTLSESPSRLDLDRYARMGWRWRRTARQVLLPTSCARRSDDTEVDWS